MTTETTSQFAKYLIIPRLFYQDFVIEGPDGMILRDSNGRWRTFKTRNSARKRIARERAGNFHK
jgi:hypothetical protein